MVVLVALENYEIGKFQHTYLLKDSTLKLTFLPQVYKDGPP